MTACPQCEREMQLAPDGAIFCPECRIAIQSPGRTQVTSKPTLLEQFARFPATTTLIALNVIVFLAMWLVGHVSPTEPTIGQLIRWGANSGDKILLGNQWWRIITAAFIHIGIVHLLMNMWALWVIGTLAEAVLGLYLYLGAYIVCAIAGSLGSVLWHPAAVGAGASGAIIGILGVLVSVLKFAHLPLPKPVLRSTTRSLVQGAVLTLVIGIAGPFDNAAHVGGLICGLFIGLLLSWTRRADANVQRPLRTVALVAPFALMVPLAFAAQHHSEPWLYYERAIDSMRQGNFPAAEKNARKALSALPRRPEVLDALSKALYYQNKDAEARRYLEQLIAVDPKNEFAVNSLAVLDLRSDDAIAARDLLQKSLPHQPRNAFGQFCLGRALQALNQDQEAITHYRNAVQIDPNLYEAQIALGSIYEKEHQPAEAILFYQRAAQIHPKDLYALQGLARAYLGAGMKQQADTTIAEIQTIEKGREQQQNSVKQPSKASSGS